MQRALVLFGILVAFSCSREHGDAPAGQFAPGGMHDRTGNSATARALGTHPPSRAEQEPNPWVEGEGTLSNVYDAGAQDLRPFANVSEASVDGTVVAVEEGAVRIRSGSGAPVHLELEPWSEVRLDGSLASEQSLRPGAEVRATYVIEEGRRVANTVDVSRSPGEGAGAWMRRLQPPGAASGEEAPRPGQAPMPEGAVAPERQLPRPEQQGR